MKETALNLINLLESRGHIALIAGGAVRDNLMGLTPKDHDIATSARPEQISEILISENIKIIPIGAAFGVIVAHIKGVNIEIATFRQDGDYSDSRRPDEVAFILDPREDAARRDFTINALFQDARGDILDFFQGSEDIQDGIIRAVGTPGERLSEDPLRMLRAVRFAARYGFTIEPETAKAIKDHAGLINNISQERIAKELELMLIGANPSRAMQLLKDLNLIQEILPEIVDLWSEKGNQDPIHHTEGNTWNHTLMVLDILSESEHKTPGLMFAGLLHDIGKPLTQEIMADGKITNYDHDTIGEPIAKNIAIRLKLKGDDIQFISYAVKIHMRLHNLGNMRKSKQMAILSHSRILELIDLQDGDARGRGNCCQNSMKEVNLELLEYFKNEAPLKLHETPLVNGKLLISLGLKPSPLFKVIITAGSEAQINGEISDEIAALDWVKGFMRNG